MQKFAPSDDALNLFNGITVLDSNNNPQDCMVADENLLTMITENASTTAANEDLANLKKKTYGLYGLYAYDRPGARTKYGYHGPSRRG